MYLIPKFDDCLVCEAVRPELGGKSIILGYVGICPNVDISVGRLDQPIFLTFLVTGGPGNGVFDATFQIVDDKGLVVGSIGPWQFKAIPTSATTLASTLAPTFGHPGVFALRVLVRNIEQFRAVFRIGQAPAGQTARV